MLRPIAIPAALIALWAVWSSGGTPSLLVPSPADVWAEIVRLTLNGMLPNGIAATLARVAVSFALGLGLAIPLGVWLGLSMRAESYFAVLVNGLRPVPVTAWIPLSIFWFGIGNLPGIFLMTYAVLFPMVVGTIQAVRDVDTVLVDAARTMGASRRQLLFKVILPGAAPGIFGAARIALGLAFVTSVAAELLAVDSGLGYLIMLARNALRIDTIAVCMIAIGLVGFGLDRIGIVLARRWFSWRSDKIGTA